MGQELLSERGHAVRLAAGIGYEGAGTVEFVYDVARGEYHFLEMNTRIQVEHPVTEEITGLDLVALQLQVAGGAPLPLEQEDVIFTGHAVECRVTAESAADGFRPSPGTITRWAVPDLEGVRVDTHCYPGYTVPPFYDSLLAKIVTHGADRDQAIERMLRALDGMVVEGITTTLPYLSRLVASERFRSGDVTTTWLEREHLASTPD